MMVSVNIFSEIGNTNDRVLSQGSTIFATPVQPAEMRRMEE